MNAQQAGRQIDYERRTDDLKAGNPGVSDESVAFGLRRAREIFERRHNPIKVELSELQLAAVMAGAHNNGDGDKFRAELREQIGALGFNDPDQAVQGSDATDFLGKLYHDLGGPMLPVNYGGTD